jgi:lipid-A-disaccharide synthase
LRDSDLLLDLYITANSPGEISGWVAPVVREVRSRLWDCRVSIVILPCQYASGEELTLSAEIGADRCFRIGELNANTSGGKTDKTGKKLVLRLGGDLLFAVYIAKKLKAPLWAYSGRPGWNRFVERFYLPDSDAMRRFALCGLPKEKYELIGNLALDSVAVNENEEETREILGLSREEPVISCLAGSRPVEYCEATPFLARIASLVTRKFPDHKVLFPLAPTVREDLLMKALDDAGIERRGETRVHSIGLGDGRWGTVVRGRTLESLVCSRLAITVPGTNNLQAAALYVPFIMILPLHKADEYPLDGLPGILPLWFPGVRKLKKSYIVRLNERTDFVSLPNKMAKKMIAPEIRGFFTAEDVALKAISLLGDEGELKRIQRAFWELTHERGASVTLASKIAEWAKKTEK